MRCRHFDQLSKTTQVHFPETENLLRAKSCRKLSYFTQLPCVGLSGWVVYNHRCSYVSGQCFFFFVFEQKWWMASGDRSSWVVCITAMINVVILIIYITQFCRVVWGGFWPQLHKYMCSSGSPPALTGASLNITCAVSCFPWSFWIYCFLRSHWYYVCICTTFSLPSLNLITKMTVYPNLGE